MQTILVADEPSQWAFLSGTMPIVSAAEYLAQQTDSLNQSLRVINACGSYVYQTAGYYVSLLAEARIHEVIPSVTQIQDTLNTYLFQAISQQLLPILERSLKEITTDHHVITLYFGQDKEHKYHELAQRLHHLFPLPLVRIKLINKKKWVITAVVPLSIQDIAEDDCNILRECALNSLSTHQAYPSTSPKTAHRLAMLINKSDRSAPSNEKALANFIEVGANLGLHIDLITQQDAKRLPHYDALFIRTTTAVNHYTYHLARQAERYGLIVMDDPQSIVKCTNKIFLAELFNTHQVMTPETQFINQSDPKLPSIQFPCVIKRPDSSCSKGVRKINDLKTFNQVLPQFFKTSDLILVQPFIPTTFDWRIGIIDNKPLWACRYFMAKNHWQIVNWKFAAKNDILIHETVLITDVPPAVIELALKAAKLIGNGLYGVDIKSVDDTHYVIEINDNPSINCGIEDHLLQTTLYETILKVFLQRLEERPKRNYY